jgi:hypothetical protein
VTAQRLVDVTGRFAAFEWCDAATDHEEHVVGRVRQRLDAQPVEVDIAPGTGPRGMHAEAGLTGDHPRLAVVSRGGVGEPAQPGQQPGLHLLVSRRVGSLVADLDSVGFERLREPGVQRVDQDERLLLRRIRYGAAQVEGFDGAPVRRPVGAMALHPGGELGIAYDRRRDDDHGPSAGRGMPRGDLRLAGLLATEDQGQTSHPMPSRTSATTTAATARLVSATAAP